MVSSRGPLPIVPIRKIVTIDSDLEASIVAYRDDVLPGASDSEVIRTILRDWLIDQGYLEVPADKDEQ